MDIGTVLYLRYLEGDNASLEELIGLYKDGLILYLDSFLHDIHTAEDLTEETFIKIAIRRPRYVPQGQFQAWLYKIARNLAISHLRKVSRVKALPLEAVGDFPDDALSLEQSYLLQERRIAVRRALRKINPDYAQVLYLTYFAGFDNGQVAAIMKKRKRQVENMLYQAKKVLKAVLSKEECFYEEP